MKVEPVKAWAVTYMGAICIDLFARDRHSAHLLLERECVGVTPEIKALYRVVGVTVTISPEAE